MGEGVLAFLKFLRTSYIVGIQENSRLRIVCGNEAADLDSVVCAITYAYFSYIKDPSRPVLPFVNIMKQDLELRRDIVWVLKQRNIPHSLLYFQEDLGKLKRNLNCKIDAILVDHNDQQSVARKLVDSVIGIIDHHQDLGLHSHIEDGPRIVTKAGSCSSLVSNYWLDTQKLKNSNEWKNTALLSVSALLMDTSNMSRRVESPDLVACERYKTELGDFNFDRYFDNILQAKEDITGLSLRDILRKDYKEFDFLSGQQKSVKCGMASVVKSLDWIIEEYSVDNFASSCSDFLDERSLDILLILTSWTQEGEFRRQLAFYAKTPENIQTSRKVATKVQASLILEPLPSSMTLTDSKFLFYNQLNTDASRKQVVPHTQTAIQSL
ncbi:LAQU0S22e00430g1_1 [Lachancea quebecensis]|uniref:LAQU0S22e00430g1_1 n=1 Tax=Lachancea quebecensis TaxID=1654605 RepID=A0A0P1KY27_9SACH|nr:LAQU0S22e00430g1_1 [Lachancea quebecensis]